MLSFSEYDMVLLSVIHVSRVILILSHLVSHSLTGLDQVKCVFVDHVGFIFKALFRLYI